MNTYSVLFIWLYIFKNIIAIDITDGFVNMMIKDNDREFIMDKIDKEFHHVICICSEPEMGWNHVIDIYQLPDCRFFIIPKEVTIQPH